MIKPNGKTVNIGKFPNGNLLETVFKDGKMIKDYTLDEIRQRLNGGEF